MERHLLRRLHDVKYRELIELVGREIMISNLAGIASDVLAAVEPYLPACGKIELSSTNMRGVLAKYKMLDLSFITTNPVLSKGDRLDRKKLVALGFVPGKETAGMDDGSDDEDPTCLAELVQDAQVGHEWLKVFLDVEPRRDSMAEYLHVYQEAEQAGAKDASSTAYDRLLRQVDSLFPSRFRIRDACVTNSDFVWFHKHFYM